MTPITVIMAPVTAALYALTFAVGACVGSFLNVCIARMPEDLSVIHPPSRCPGCATPIAWYDNVPILAWFWLGARCRTCHATISVRYPFVEAATGVLAATALWRFGWTPVAAVAFVFMAALLLVSAIDFDHLFIPDEVSLGGTLAGLAIAAFVPTDVSLADAALGAALGGGLLWVVASGWSWLRGIEAMGLGDVKLLAMIGAFLGWQAIPGVLIVASCTGSLGGLVALTTARGRHNAARVARRFGRGAMVRHLLRTKIPFGPFLALGAVAVLFVPDLALPLAFLSIP